MKKVKLFLSLAISLLTIVGLTSKAHAVTHYVQFSTPTIFVHGWGNSSHAEEKMANAARDAGVTKIIMLRAIIMVVFMLRMSLLLSRNNIIIDKLT